MRIVIDIQGMQTHQSRMRGVGRYVSEVVKEFVKLSRAHEVTLVANDNYGDTEESLRDVLGDVHVAMWHYRGGDVRDIQRDREKFILKMRPDLVWMPNLQEGFGEDTTTSVNKTVGSSCIWVTTLHDVIPIIFKEEYLKDPVGRSWYEEKIEQTKNCDYLFTVSEFSRDRISELLPFDKSKIFVVPPAVNLDTFNVGEVASTNRSPYILFVSGYNPHKNVERLIKAYAALPDDVRSTYKLLLVGAALAHHHQQYVTDNGIQNVEFLHSVSADDLINYYRNCSLFVFPSYAEGFGIPPLEAMACGAPTITSNAHSLPEVIGMPEAMFDPFDVQQMATTIHKGLTDDAFRNKLIHNGTERANHFSWRKSAQYALSCFEEMYNRN